MACTGPRTSIKKQFKAWIEDFTHHALHGRFLSYQSLMHGSSPPRSLLGCLGSFILLIIIALLIITLTKKYLPSPMVGWTGLVAVPWAYVLGASFCQWIQQPIDTLMVIVLGMVTVCAQAMLASGPIAKGLSQMADALPGIVKTAQAEMQKGLEQHIKHALSPLLADTPAEQSLDRVAELVTPVLNNCIVIVSGLLDVRKMTPGFMRRPALMAGAIGIFMTAVIVAFAIPIFTNFIQFHIGIFSIAVLVIQLVLFVVAWNAHRVIQVALRLVENLYNAAFGGLLGKVLDDANLDAVVQVILDPGGAGLSTLGYLAGAVVGTVLSPVSYLTASSGDVEKTQMQDKDGEADDEEVDDEDADNETYCPSGESAAVVDDSAHPLGQANDAKHFTSSLKKRLIMATHMEFAWPGTEAGQASKDESGGGHASGILQTVRSSHQSFVPPQEGVTQ